MQATFERSPPLRRSTLSITSLALCLCALAAFAAACGSSGDDDSEDLYEGVPPPAEDRSEHPWKIVVSMPIFADFAREMAGNQAVVTTLIPIGVDPHTYEPTEDQIAAIQEADIVFVNGSGLDDPTIDFIERNRPDRRFFVVDFVRNIPSPTHQQPVDQPIYAKDVGDDPHLYLDPVLVPVYVETVSHSLIIVDGLNESYYDGRFRRYKERLGALHTMMTEELGRIPAENREAIVMPHNSLIHLARRYGLKVSATLADDGESGVRDFLAANPNAVAFEETGRDDGGVLGALATETGATVCNVHTDTIDDEGMSYLEMMEYDTAELADCLGG